MDDELGGVGIGVFEDPPTALVGPPDVGVWTVIRVRDPFAGP